MNNPQWLWYAAQLAADDKEKFELLRDIAEHNASFWNPEGVDQIRRAREKTFTVSDKDFARQIEETFGRKFSIPDRKESSVLPLNKPKQTVRPKMRDDVDVDTYLNAKLDEVKFIPLGK